ncbi:hypothetical protein REC12_00225 [Desulfosporosinus sp. PR]|uniref:hypothetical protein n=1 Tax=Candidatus Desulfosporosinus nitrosoreducens TaxID=3401928 RepID=UPI0027F71355|nr:hypothetical protein [Desulfosporosinus sp. PR]MDQ7092020.1 hypothetical protein [Desulfosporosinus sp. PR]
MPALMLKTGAWEYQLLPRISQLSALIFAGLSKNAGKTTAFNALNALFPGQPLGLTSIGHDGEAFDAIDNHPKPPIPVFPGQLVLTAERFLPENEAGYNLLEKWGNHPQYGPWLILRVTAPGNLRLAGPSTLSELRLGVSNLRHCGATRIHIDGALNRLSHICLFSSPALSSKKERAEFEFQDTGIILSLGAAWGDTWPLLVEQSLHILELFKLPTFTSQRNSANAKLKADIPLQHNAYLQQDTWTCLPAPLWHQELLIPPHTEVIYLKGAFTDAFYLTLRAQKRLPQKFVVRSPAQILLSLNTWQILKSGGIAVQLLERPKLALITLCPWHPRNPVSTCRLAEALLPYSQVPLVDVQSRQVWLPAKC